MRRAASYLAAVLALGASAGSAQQMNSLTNFQGASWEGIHLYGVSAFTSYVSSAFPLTTSLTVLPGAAQLGYDLSYGVSASAGWQYHREDKFGLNVFYTATYNRSENYSSLTSLGHNFRANAFWELTPKLTVDFSANAIYQNLAEYLFEPTGLSTAAQSSASAGNLAAAMGVGQFTSPQAAAALTGGLAAGVSPQANPATSLLLGNRIFNYATQASLSYQATSRLSFNFSGVSAAGQSRTGGTSTTPSQTYLLPRTIGLTAGGSLDFELSPRTTVGIGVNGGRNSNIYQNAYTTSAEASLGRMMGMHWFLRGSGGGSYSTVVQQQQGAPKTRQLIGSGSLGYALFSQSFIASYNRTSMDASGFAVGTTSRLSGSWAWHESGRRWSLSISAGQQQVRNTGFVSLSGWNGSVTWLLHLVDNLILTTQYAHSDSTGTYVGNTTKISVNSVRVQIGWVPSALQAAAQGSAAVLRPQQ